MNIIETHDVELPRKFFVDIGGFSGTDFNNFCRRNDIRSGEQGYKVFEIIRSLNRERMARQQDDGKDIERELKLEKIQETRIKNQERLKELIPKAVAKERVRKAFTAVANMIRYAHKRVSPRVAICSNVRDCENILTAEYNKAVDYLSKDHENISWEADCVEIKLGRTGMAEDTSEDSGGEGDNENDVTSKG